MRSIKRAGVRRPVWRRKSFWVVLILIVVGAGGGAGWYFWMGPGQPTTVDATSTTQTYTTTVRRGNLSISASGSGVLATGQSVDLSFPVSAMVSELNVQVGDTVQAGDVLARQAQSPSLEASLADAQLQLLQAQQSLDALQANAGLSLAQAYQSLLKAQATYDDANTAFVRLAYSKCSQAVATRYQAAVDRTTEKLQQLAGVDETSQDWINARSEYDTAVANLAQCSYTNTEKVEINANLEVAKNALQQAQKTYDTLKSGAGIDPDELALDEAKLKTAQTQLTAAEDNLAALTMTAPITGKVTYLAGSAGTLAGTSKFITISSFDHLILTVSLDETDLDQLVMGSQAEIVFDVLPEQTFSGSVTQVDPALTTSGQYRVAKGVVTLDQDSTAKMQNLPLGLNATVTIISQQAKDALLVPLAALKDLGDGQYAVMRMDSSGKLTLQLVQIGIQDSTSAVVTSGLNEGDRISTGTTQVGNPVGSSSGSSNTNQNDPGMMLDPGMGGAPPDMGGGAPLP